MAFAAVLFAMAWQLSMPGRFTDFGMAWFGARSMIHGVNPYPLVGPGLPYEWNWSLLYPATSFVFALPFALLPQFAASLAFVFVSAWLLAFYLTRESWHRLFLIPSASFLVAAGAAQWSPLMAAACLQPALGLVLAVKPNVGLSIAASTASRKLLLLAIIGGIGMLLVSLAFLPTWPFDWIARLRLAKHMVIPMLRPGGILILAALLRWRRPEARLLVTLACVPQTGSWYEALLPSLAATTRRECQLLSIISSVGYIASLYLVPLMSEAQINRDVMTFMVWFAYLPAVFVVLRRQNEGDDWALLRLGRGLLALVPRR